MIFSVISSLSVLLFLRFESSIQFIQIIFCALAKLHSFASFGLRVGLCGLQMCAMCGCPEFLNFCAVGKKLNTKRSAYSVES
jgi:hypothetical protein